MRTSPGPDRPPARPSAARRPTSGDATRRRLDDVRRSVRAHRRWWAAGSTAVAALLVLGSVGPSADPTADVVVAAGDLVAGTRLEPDDLRVQALPVEAVPGGSVDDPADLQGAVLASPLRGGEVVTDRRVLAPDLVEGYPPGTTLATVRVADPLALWGVEPGRTVDVLATDLQGGPVQVVAEDAGVVALPGVDSDEAAAGPYTVGAPLVLAVDADDATALAEAATSPLGVVLTVPEGS